jgi:PAS domain S-box-containing protein
MTFRRRTILGTIAVQAIAGIMLTISALALIDQAGRTQLSHRADSGVRLAAALLREPVVAGDWKTAEHLAAELVEGGDFGSLQIFDASGHSIVEAHGAETPQDDGWITRRLSIFSNGARIGEIAIAIDDDWQDQVLAGAKTSLGVISLLAVALAGIIACGLGTYLTRQLAAVRDAANSIAAGHFDVQVDADGAAEFRAVAEAINLMSARIGALYADLAHTLADRTHALVSTFAHIPEGVTIFDADGRMLAANAAFAQLHGFPPEELRPGVTLDALIEAHRVRGTVEEEFLTRWRSPQWDGPRLNFELPLRDGRVIAIQRTRLPDGGFITIHEDVTRQREDQRRLQHAAKLATLGELATATAHELNQPLNVIRLSADNARARMANGSATPEYLAEKLERIALQTKRAAAIIDHMRIFGRKPAEAPEPFDLAAPLRAATEFFAETARLRGYRLEVTLLPDLVVYGHAILVEQVAANILSNAMAAMARDPAIAAPTIRLRTLRRRGRARVEISDNAGGIPAEVLPRIFDPFFTTKPAGEGTGLGLSISYGIVADMGGWLEARNENGGAVFSFDLPLYETKPAAEPAAAVNLLEEPVCR